jgi:hypothetical protein
MSTYVLLQEKYCKKAMGIHTIQLVVIDVTLLITPYLITFCEVYLVLCTLCVGFEFMHAFFSFPHRDACFFHLTASHTCASMENIPTY